MAIAFRQDPLGGVDDVVVRENGRLQARPGVDDLLRRRAQRHHVLAPGVAAHNHYAVHPVPYEIREDVADERLERIDGHAHGARVRTRRRADSVGDRRSDEGAGPARDLFDDVHRLDHVRTERQVPAVLLERADRDDDDGIFAGQDRELLGRHLVESHGAESPRRP